MKNKEFKTLEECRDEVAKGYYYSNSGVMTRYENWEALVKRSDAEFMPDIELEVYKLYSAPLASQVEELKKDITECMALLEAFVNCEPNDGTWNYQACMDMARRIVAKRPTSESIDN